MLSASARKLLCVETVHDVNNGDDNGKLFHTIDSLSNWFS